jgi:hypothetical protein
MVTSVHAHKASHRVFQEHPEALAPVFDALRVPLTPTAAIEALYDMSELLTVGLDGTAAAATWGRPRGTAHEM